MPERAQEPDASPNDWNVFEAGPSEMIKQNELTRACGHCLSGNHGAVLRRYLQTVVERCLGPDVADEELRHLMGERTLAARILSMANLDIG